MYAQERQRQILEALDRSGRVAVTDLAERFEVTTETVRRDLNQLASASLLLRVHGGAVPRRGTDPETDVETRRTTNIDVKRRIAAKALSLLPADPGTSLLLDAGTTIAEVVPLLGRHRGPVITNSPSTAHLALSHPELEVHMLPGRVRSRTQAAVGSSTVAALDRLHPDIVLLGCNGIDGDGLTTPDPDEAAVKAAMVASAGLRVVLADSSKVGARHLVTFATTADIDMLITDPGIPEETAQDLADKGIEVFRA